MTENTGLYIVNKNIKVYPYNQQQTVKKVDNYINSNICDYVSM